MASYYEKVKAEIAQGTFRYPDVDQFPILQKFLGNLVRLAGVPIHYLLPDEKCIPLQNARRVVAGEQMDVEIGQIRFFFVDKNWISQLVKGAISFIADANTRDHLRGLAMDGRFIVTAEYKDHLQRSTPDFPIRLDEASTTIDSAPAAFNYVDGKPQPTSAQRNFYYSGFLMRSTLVAHWPGIEIRLRGGDDTQAQAQRSLRIVRMERLADDLLFVICEGVVTSIQIVQPPEMTHFAAPILGEAVDARSRCMDFGQLGDSPMALVQTLIARPMDITYPITIT